VDGPPCWGDLAFSRRAGKEYQVPVEEPSFGAVADALVELTWDFRRTLLWFRSSIMNWSEYVESRYEAEAMRLLMLIWRQVRAVTDLAQQAPDNFAPAPILARAAFEGGLTCNWLLQGEDAKVCEGRWLVLQYEAAQRMRRVSRQLHEAGIPSDRWRQEAVRLENLTSEKGVEGRTRRPNVLEMLRSLGLERLYFGYILASQWSHGTILAGREHAAEQRTPFSLGEWYTPFNMSIWGILFGARGYLQRPGGPGLKRLQGTPLGDAQDTLQVLLAAWEAEGATAGEESGAEYHES